MPNLYKVAIVGRVNVGKSSLFNRLISQKKALTSSVRGTTRDRNYAICSWQDLDFYLIDTGGLEKETGDDIEKQIIEQAFTAIKEADLVLMVVDVRTGIMATDKEISQLLKKQKKLTVLVANKADNNKQRQDTGNFYQLGLGQAYPVSASNGIGSGDLLDIIVDNLKKIKKSKKTKSLPEEDKGIKVAMIGKPNVGKSSLINAMIGEKRAIISSQPHTTRDSQDVHFEWKGERITLIDTAGMSRKRNRPVDAFERQSVDQSALSLKKADIVLIVTDVSKKLSWQDKHIIDEATSAGRGIIMIANKWDLIPDKDTQTAKKYIDYYHSYFPFINWAPILFCSATEKVNMKEILKTVLEVYENKNKTINDTGLNRLLKDTIKKHRPSRGKGTNYPYLYSLKQIKTNPPTFLLKMNFKADLHDSYLRFLENNLRYKFGFMGSPIKIIITKSENAQDKN